MEWPFKHMRVGDRVAITENIARARAYVHVYAAHRGKRFKTQLLKTPDGQEFLGVRRLPDAPGTVTESAEQTVWGALDRRTSWPFKTLQVGETVEGLVADKQKAATAAYMYARQSGKRFDLEFSDTAEGLRMAVTRRL